MNANQGPMTAKEESTHCEGLLLVDKPVGKTSFSLVGVLRRLLGVKKIGHAGTLDPFATGVMVMLVGRSMTRLSDQFLCSDKEYLAQVHLGVVTDTYDCEGQVTHASPHIPSLEDIQQILHKFQGENEQIPPMYSAKKVKGQKLYDLARKGQVIERRPVKVVLDIEFLNYDYPRLDLRIKCSKGTYIRSIAHDMGQLLGCGAHLQALRRTRSGSFKIEDCIIGSTLFESSVDKIQLRKALFQP